MQGVYYPPKRDDQDATVKIGIFAGPSNTTNNSGVVIGGGCLMQAPDAGQNTIVGGSIMRGSTSTNSHNNVILGQDCCQSQTGGNFSSNVCIEHQCCTDTSTATNVTGNIFVGANSGRGTVQNNIVCIGNEAGNVAGGGIIHAEAICIGASTGLMFGAQNVGASSISIGTGSASKVPSHSVLIGTLAAASGSASGQMVLGNRNYHSSLRTSVSGNVAMETGSGGTLTNSLALTPTAAEIKATSGTTKLTCGSNSIELSATKVILPALSLILSGVVCDSDGKSLFVGNSYHFSGRSDVAVSTKKRRIVVDPSCVWWMTTPALDNGKYIQETIRTV